MRCLVTIVLVLSTVQAGAEEPRTLEELRTRLADPSPDTREQVVRDLVNGEYRSLAADDVLSVVEPLLKTPSADLEQSVQQGLLMELLGGYREQARRVLPLLLKHVGNREARDYVRQKAMDAAVRIGPDDPDVVAALTEAAGDDRVCQRAAERLGEMGPVAAASRPALVRLLEHEFHSVQDTAFIALGRSQGAPEHGITTEEAHRTIREWRTGSQDDLSAALLYLQTWAKKRERARIAEEAVEQVRQWVARRPDSPRSKRALAEAEAAAKRAREEARLTAERRIRESLRALAAETNDHRQRAAIRTLGAIGPGSDPAVVRTLLDTLQGPNAGVAETALRALDGSDQRSVVLLVDELKRRLEAAREIDEETAARTNLHWHQPVVLAEALTRFGPRAAPAAPLLVEELHRLIGWRAPSGADRHQARAYLATLGAIGDPNEEAIGAIVAVLENPPPPTTPGGIRWDVHFDLRRPAFLALAATGLPEPGALRTKALAELGKSLSADRSEIVSAAANAIRALGPSLEDDEAGPLVQSLTTLVEVDDEAEITESGWIADSRVSAIEALAALGPRARPAHRALEGIANRELPDGHFFPALHQRRTLILAARSALDAITKE